MVIAIHRIKITTTVYIALLLAFALVACETANRNTLEQAEDQGMVWPSPPDAPRVAYVTSFSTPADLGIRKSFAAWVSEIISGSSTVHLIRPMAIAVTPDGTIYVADPGAEGVHRFDTKDGKYQLIRGEQGRILPSPVALAAGPSGEIYITDSQLSALFVVEPGTTEAVRMPLQATLAQPTGVALEPASGRLFVVDTGDHKVKVFARDGAFLMSFGHRGSGAGEFNFPTMIWRNKLGQYLVTDTLNFRIQIFDADGRYLGQFGQIGDATGHHAQPKGIASDSEGHIYVVDSLFHSVQLFDPFGTYLLTLGQQGHERGEFWLPTGIYIGERDTIFVADSYNKRVQVFRYLGGAP